MAQDFGGELLGRLERLERHAQLQDNMLREIRSLIGPWAVNLGNGNLLVHTLHKLLLIVDSLDLILTPQLVVYRQWEPEISELLWNSLRSDTVFVDIGANIGYFTCLAGAKIHAGGTGRVIAVEPSPKCCELLERNLTINWSMCPVALHKVAVGAEPGEVWLTSPLNRAANAHISKEEGVPGAETSFRVPVETLDSLTPEATQVDVMKIDVEGHEASVFLGARRLIQRSPDLKIIMEWSPEQMLEAGVSPEQLYALIEEAGLTPRLLPTSRNLYDITRDNSRILTLSDLNTLSYSNILLTKQR